MRVRLIGGDNDGEYVDWNHEQEEMWIVENQPLPPYGMFMTPGYKPPESIRGSQYRLLMIKMDRDTYCVAHPVNMTKSHALSLLIRGYKP